MSKVLVEFINTWPSCDGNGRTIKQVAKQYGDKVDVKIYYAGKDVGYIQKYGPIFKGTMIINERKKITRITKKTIEKEIAEAVSKLDK